MTTVRVEVVTTSPAPSRPELLEPAELERWKRLRFEADRDRLFTGVLLRRTMLRQQACRTVPVERRCRGCGADDHGEVQPAEVADRARWRTSLSHAETTVMLAVAESQGAGIDIGVDVELVSRMESGMARHMLSVPERSRLPHPTRWLLCGIWTAKEAALKALGCGLHASMSDLEVRPSSTPPESVVRSIGNDPRLHPLRERPSRLVDITDVISDTGVHAARRAALVVLGTDDVRLVHRRLTTDELWANVP